MEIYVTHPPSICRAVPVTLVDRLAEYADTLSYRQIQRLIRRIIRHTRADEYGDYVTYRVHYPQSYMALYTLINLAAERRATVVNYLDA